MKNYVILVIETGDTFYVRKVSNQSEALEKLNNKLGNGLKTNFDDTDCEIICIEDCTLIN